jgi:hypothetical protein
VRALRDEAAPRALSTLFLVLARNHMEARDRQGTSDTRASEAEASAVRENIGVKWSDDPKAYLKEWRKNNPNYMREYRRANADKIKAQERSQNLRAYGLTADDFERMEQDQGGRCAICGALPAGRWKRLFVDHDHKTGKVRGLLCHLCNSALERIDNYRKEIDRYLETTR